MNNTVQRTCLKGVLVILFISILTGCSTSEKDDKTIKPLEPLTGQALADAYSAQTENHLEIKKIQQLTTIDVKDSLFVEGTVEETCSEVSVELIDFFGRILGEKKLPVNEGIFAGEITLEKNLSVRFT